jgi:ABC-type Mn/Zn transport systems, ATPase component
LSEALHQCSLCHIDVNKISVARNGQTLLQDVSLHLHCGQLTVLIGENGAGKTTLVRALLNQLPYTGQIRHLDHENRAMARILTGYVPQQMDFDRDMPVTVQDFLAANITNRPVWLGIKKEIRQKCLTALESVSAAPLIDAPLGKLSGGELQRVLLALALTPEPDLLILDEPVSGIDQNGLRLFLDTVANLRKKHHMAVLMVSHDLALVKKYADYVVLLDKQVLCQGTPEDVFRSAAFKNVFGQGAIE